MSWAGLPAGPGGPLAAARAVRQGPPRHYQIDNEVYELRASWWPLLELLPAGAWRLPLLLDMTHPDDAAVLRRRIHDRADPFGVRDVENIATALVEHATGRPWWVAEKLYAWTLAHFGELDGRLLHVDLAEVLERSPARACNIVHMALVDGAEAKERQKFDRDLYKPPPKAIEAAPAWVAEDDSAAFLAAMGQSRGAGVLGAARPAAATPAG